MYDNEIIQTNYCVAVDEIAEALKVYFDCAHEIIR